LPIVPESHCDRILSGIQAAAILEADVFAKVQTLLRQTGRTDGERLAINVHPDRTVTVVAPIGRSVQEWWTEFRSERVDR
jgi:hypothetical protein